MAAGVPMRFGAATPTAPGSSRASSWSMPRSQPIRFSLRLSNPMRAARADRTRPARSRAVEARTGSCRSSARASSRRQSAVFAFIVMVAKPRWAMDPLSQTASCPPPTAATTAARSVATWGHRPIRLGFCGESSSGFEGMRIVLRFVVRTGFFCAESRVECSGGDSSPQRSTPCMFAIQISVAAHWSRRVPARHTGNGRRAVRKTLDGADLRRLPQVERAVPARSAATGTARRRRPMERSTTEARSRRSARTTGPEGGYRRERRDRKGRKPGGRSKQKETEGTEPDVDGENRRLTNAQVPMSK